VRSTGFAEIGVHKPRVAALAASGKQGLAHMPAHAPILHLVSRPPILPELQQMVRQFSDVRTAEMLSLPRPRLLGYGWLLVVMMGDNCRFLSFEAGSKSPCGNNNLATSESANR
jgi:hypothetical protein